MNPAGEEILSRVAETSVRRHAISYTGTRKYTLRNARFDKQASVTVKVSYSPGEGKRFSVLEQTGSDKLVDIINRLLDSEAEASRPARLKAVAISPANYKVHLRGMETVNGRSCYVLDLSAKSHSKYLLNGTAWVDRSTFGVVKIDGITAASISMWVGAPHVIEELGDVGGYWLPVHTRSVSSSFLLGTSELEIRHWGYQVARPTGMALGQEETNAAMVR
jgi:hypothetical protein